MDATNFCTASRGSFFLGGGWYFGKNPVGRIGNIRET